MDAPTQLIMDLSTLQADAAQRGDDRAATILTRAVEFLVKADADLSALQRRRAIDRERPRRVPQNPQKSAESAEIHGFRGVSPVPPSLRERQHDTGCVSGVGCGEGGVRRIRGEYDERLDRELAVLAERAGSELWPDVDAFIKRRHYDVWLGWAAEMSRLTGIASQFSIADLAQVCRDDAALERKVETPKGLRVFLQSARMERIQNATGPDTKTTKALRAIEGL